MIIKVSWSSNEGYYKSYDLICESLTRILDIEHCNIFKPKSMRYINRKKNLKIYCASGIVVDKLENLIEEKIGIAKVKDILSGLTFEIINISSPKPSFLEDVDAYVDSIIDESNNEKINKIKEEIEKVNNIILENQKKLEKLKLELKYIS